jgi:uncharacterized protein YijF (DUF1287 family)
VKKSVKSRKTSRKSGARPTKPVPQTVAWVTSTPDPNTATVLSIHNHERQTQTDSAYRSAHLPPRTSRTAPTYDTDDRGTIFLMMVPFFVIALSLGISQTMKPFINSLPTVGAAARAPVISPVPPTVLANRAGNSTNRATPISPPVAPVTAGDLSAANAAQRLAAWTPPALPWPRDTAPPRFDTPMLPTSTAPLIRPAPPLVAPMIIAPPLTLPDMAPIIGPPVIAGPNVPDAPQFCERLPPKLFPVMGRSSVVPQAVGSAISAAAVEQTKDFVVYSAKYRRLNFPMGDLASMYGSCSDVIIRAYRTIGLDLQELVQRTRLGRGDANIDHRRTETLRKFFASYGESFTPSAFPEDYQPGDIVTYYRPFSRVSRAHIAVVSDVRAPTGRFMIVHNRGWGPQLEDALFVDKMTGHYRFDGTRLPLAVPNASVSTFPVTAAAAPAAHRPRPMKPGHLSRIPMMTPTSALVEPGQGSN